MTVNKTIQQNGTDYCDDYAKDVLQEQQQEDDIDSREESSNAET